MNLFFLKQGGNILLKIYLTLAVVDFGIDLTLPPIASNDMILA